MDNLCASQFNIHEVHRNNNNKIFNISSKKIEQQLWHVPKKIEPVSTVNIIITEFNEFF